MKRANLTFVVLGFIFFITFSLGFGKDPILIKSSASNDSNPQKAASLFTIPTQTDDVGFITKISEYPINNTIRDICKKDSLLYVLAGYTYNEFRIYNFSDPLNPVLVGKYDSLLYYPYNMEVQDTLAYVTIRDSGLQIFSIADPTNPYPVGRYFRNGNYMEEIEVRGDKAYICDRNDGLYILNVSDPANPVGFRLYSPPSGGGSRNFAISDSLIVITDQYNLGLRIYNIADPNQPFLVNNYVTEYSMDFVELFDTLLLLGGSRMYVFSMTDLSYLPEVSVFDTRGTCISSEMQGDIFYSNSVSSYLEMFLLDKPDSPIRLGFDSTETSYNFAMYVEDSLIIIGGDGILSTYNTNMSNAVTCFLDEDLDSYGTSDSTYSVAIYGVCDVEPGAVSNTLDCDDTDPDINPGAVDIPYDGIDQNCDGVDQTCCVGSRGDINGDLSELPDISDLLYLVDYMFVPDSPAPPCFEEANFDDNFAIDISDLLFLIDYMFSTSGPALPSCY